MSTRRLALLVLVSLSVPSGVASAQHGPGPGPKPGPGTAKVQPNWQSSVGQGVQGARSNGAPMLVSVGRSGSTPPKMDVDVSGPRAASPNVQLMKKMSFVHLAAGDGDLQDARRIASGAAGAGDGSEVARAMARYGVDDLPAAFLTDRYGNFLAKVSPDQLTPEGLAEIAATALKASTERDQEVNGCLESAAAALSSGQGEDALEQVKECLEKILRYDGYEEVKEKVQALLEKIGK